MKKCLAVLYFLTIILSSSSTFAKQVMTWYIVSYEPAYIVEGKNKNEGFADVQLKFFIANMPEYDHKIRIANVSRIRKELQKSVGLVGTPAQVEPIDRFGNNVLVSEPNMFIPSIGVVIRKNDLKRFKNGINISLDKDLFGNKNLRAGVIQGATAIIHPTATSLIEKNKKNVLILANPDTEVSFKMLLLGRFDYFFTYPFNFKVISDRLNIQDKLMFINFKEQIEYKALYSFFTNTPESKIVLKKINQIIKTAEYKKKTVDVLLKYLPKNIKNDVLKRNGLDSN